MSHDHSIRRLEVAEEADRAAQITAETGELQKNPYPEEDERHARWAVCYARLLPLRRAPAGVDVEGSA